MSLQEKNLPNNAEVKYLKELNITKFNGNGTWHDGVARSINGIDISSVKTGIALYINIQVTHYNDTTDEHFYAFYEYDTKEDIDKELNQFEHDIKSYKSWKYI